MDHPHNQHNQAAAAPTPPQPAPANTNPDPAQPPVAQKTNSMAIAGLVCSFFVPIVGLVLSIIGYNQTKDGREAGKGMAIAGIIISAIGMLFGLLYIVLLVIGLAANSGS